MIETEGTMIDNETPLRATVRIEQDGRPLFAITMFRSSEQSDGDIAKLALETYLGARHREHSIGMLVSKIDNCGRCEIGGIVFTARVAA